MSERETWERIEAEAHIAGLEELARLENTPLEFGAHIAWTLTGWMGRTDGISEYVHRVGYALGQKNYTTCGEDIPNPLRWLTLSPALVASMTACRHCEAEYQRILRANAA